MARLQSCCCGCSLQLGCKILAILGLIGGVLQAISTFGNAASISSEKTDRKTKVVAYVIIIGIGSSLFNIVISGLLLQGVNTRRKGFLLPWIIITIIEVVVFVIFAIIIIVLTQIQTVGIVIFIFFCLLGLVLLSSYFIAVVISFYQELSERLGGYGADPLRSREKC